MTTTHRSSLPGPDDIFQATLDNGLRLFVRENHNSPSAVISGYLPGGAVHEPAEKAGLSAFTASMLMRGTENRSFDEINDAVESVGASLSVYGARHAVGVGAKSLAEDFSGLLEILADVLRHPVFPDEHVARVRGQRLTALQERDNDTRSVASLLMRSLAYPEDHPYHQPVEGYQKTISGLERANLVDFYRRTYSPTGGALVIVGAVRADDVVAQVQEALGPWQAQPAEEPACPPVTALASVLRREKVLPGKTQSDIVLGVPGMRRSDPQYYAARLADTVLGRFGLMGRLGEHVREQLGLAYYAYSSLTAGREPGLWSVVAGINPANVASCLAAVEEELARLGSDLVPEEELNDSKAFLTGSQPLQLETNDGVAQAVLDMVWYDLGLDYLRQYPQLIDAVSAEEVRAVAGKYLKPGAYALAIAGPSSDGVP